MSSRYESEIRHRGEVYDVLRKTQKEEEMPPRFYPLPEPIFIAERRVGNYLRDPDGIVCLEKTGLDPQIHKMRRPSGWSLEIDHLATLAYIANGQAARVRLVLFDGTRLQATLALFDTYGISVNRGFGQQTMLTDKWWSPGTTQRQMRMEV